MQGLVQQVQRCNACNKCNGATPPTGKTLQAVAGGCNEICNAATPWGPWLSWHSLQVLHLLHKSPPYLCNGPESRSQDLAKRCTPICNALQRRTPRTRLRLCPRCGRGPLTGGKCGWCRGTGSSGDRRAVSKLTSRALNQENREK